jgi:hypothetical protein
VKPNYRKIFAFLLLITAVIFGRTRFAGQLQFFLATVAIILFWFLHSMKFSLTNFRTILLMLAGFGVAVFTFQDRLPFFSSEGVTGKSLNLDFTPGMVASLKTSHELAFEIYLDHRPSLDDRYLKTGSFKQTADGLHYQLEKTPLHADLLPETKLWADATLQGKTLSEKESLISAWWARDFHYSLNPGTLKDAHPLDTFLFERKIGFCEHYAAALTTLLKLSGTEAGIATGFSGGYWNPLLRKLSFEMADAHAWVEAFDAKTKTWHRIDPTLWVSPNANEARLDRTSELFLAGSCAALLVILGLSLFFSRFQNKRPLETLLREVERFEKKRKIESRGLTLHERFQKFMLAYPKASGEMRESLALYQMNYYQYEPNEETQKLLARSVRKWKYKIRF